MKNPLNRRLPRELKSDGGKYVVIFLLLTALIGFVSGFLVADDSMRIIYDDSFTTYQVEDGYFDLKKELTKEQERAIEEQKVTVYENYYIEETMDNDSTLRIFQNRESVDRVCLMEGKMPEKTGEIALDRMYAINNQINLGDTIASGESVYQVTGYVALSDYSSLFSNNNDTMFDAVKFGVAIVTEDTFQQFPGKSQNFRYAWTYEEEPASEQEEHDRAEDLMKSMGKVVTLESFVPRYQNQAIQFTGDDMGSDRSMMLVLLSIVIVILAFVFGITISNTISREASTIGTLRALGYTRGELVRHYLILPLAVTFAGSVAGNILGYTLLEQVVVNMYYGSYSLTKYVTTPSAEAFAITTVLPFLVMLIINLVILSVKLTLSPLKFLRRDLSRRKQKTAIPLSGRIPFLSRFRLRIIIQNWSNYGMLLMGILFANLLLMFGMGLPVVLDHYQANIKSNMLSNYQYLLSVPTSILSEDSKVKSMIALLQFSHDVETDNDTAEKFSAYSLNTTDPMCDSEEILLYGVESDSAYVSMDFKGDGVYVSSAYADKYRLNPGDTITLKEKYQEDTYSFQVAGIYDYIGALSVFLPREQLNQTFDLDKDYFSGYFSDTPITDINTKYIGSVIDLETLTKVSRQLDVSMGSMMYLVDGFALLIFVALIYLLSKLVIEKNAGSISMTKILGYSNGEIGRLYILATSLVVVASLLATMWIDYYLITWIFRQMMIRSMSGWIQFEIDNSVFIHMFEAGMITYGIVALMEIKKIQRVPMDEALKHVE